MINMLADVIACIGIKINLFILFLLTWTYTKVYETL
jgi:hypothetical protein